MTDQQAQPLTESPLANRLRGYCECVDAIREEGNDDCCDFRQAASTIDALRLTLERLQHELLEQESQITRLAAKAAADE